MMATNPAAFGATESHAMNGVLPASYVSGAHMWNGNAAILNPSPARTSASPSIMSGCPCAIAGGTAASTVVPITPYMKDIP